MPQPHGHYISTSDARKRLPQLVARVQDPREWVILTRHGREVAAIVSFEDLCRIFDIWLEDMAAERPPLPDGLVRIPGGGVGTPRQAAEKVRKAQMTRAAERAALEAGGLEVVPGGELRVEGERPDQQGETSGGPIEDRTGGAPDAAPDPQGAPQTEAEWDAWFASAPAPQPDTRQAPRRARWWWWRGE